MPYIEVVNKACPLLASIAEEGKAKSKESIEAVHEYMEIFKTKNVDTLILGCTHYPIYDEIIKKEFSNNITLINTGMAVAQKIKTYLSKNDMENKDEKVLSKIRITKEEKDFENKAKNILKLTGSLDFTTIN